MRCYNGHQTIGVTVVGESLKNALKFMWKVRVMNLPDAIE